MINKPLFVSIPHSGEKVPVEAKWLSEFPEEILMCDVDRYVNQLYAPVIAKLQLKAVIAEWHRYVIDLNRFATDVDQDAVEESVNPAGKFTSGLHWVKTTTGIRLMEKPIAKSLHLELVKKYFDPFHAQILVAASKMRKLSPKMIYHLDLHSMPSMGTSAHRDPGCERPDIVVSDCKGTSSSTEFKDLVISAYERAGFLVKYNWPYLGGRLTEAYGKPSEGHHAIQVELKRGLYMNETTKRKVKDKFLETQKKLGFAMELIVNELA